SSSSSFLIWVDSVGWLTKQAAAARPKCLCSASAIRYLRSRRFISTASERGQISSLLPAGEGARRADEGRAESMMFEPSRLRSLLTPTPASRPGPCAGARVFEGQRTGGSQTAPLTPAGEGLQASSSFGHRHHRLRRRGADQVVEGAE